MVALNSSVRFARPSDVAIECSFTERFQHFAGTLVTWNQQFTEADRRATARGLQLPAALNYNWLLFAVRYLFNYSDRHFRTPADLRSLSQTIHLLNCPSGTSSNLGTMVDVAPEVLKFYDWQAPLPRPAWRPPTVPHLNDLKYLLPKESWHNGGEVDLLSVDAFLDRAAFLLIPSGNQDADWRWLEQVFFTDGDGSAGTGGPYLINAYKDAYKYVRDQDHPAGGVRDPYPEPGATRWLLDHPQLPAWRHLVVENVTSAARHFTLAHGTPPLSEIPRDLPFSGLADLLLRYAISIESASGGEAQAQQYAVKDAPTPKMLKSTPEELGTENTKGESTCDGKREFQPYRHQDQQLIYQLDTRNSFIHLTPGERAVIDVLLRAGESGVVFASLPKAPASYPRHICNIKSKLKIAGIPDYIVTPGNDGKGVGGVYAVRMIS